MKKRHSLSPKILSHSQLPPLGCTPAPVWPSGLTDNPGQTFWSTLDSFVRREEKVLQLAAFRALAPVTVFTLKYTFVFTTFIKKMLKQNIDTIYYNLLRVETDPARITTSSPPPTTARPTASLPAPALIYDVCYQECVYFYFIKF